ncbi:hypothetical protein REPUB_Repub10bG0148900 [Reevesia pubescens]
MAKPTHLIALMEELPQTTLREHNLAARDSFDNERTENYLDKARESDKGSSNTLEAKVAELRKTKEELKRAKDNAIESWLDSKPLIDELERPRNSSKSTVGTVEGRQGLRAQSKSKTKTNLPAEEADSSDISTHTSSCANIIRCFRRTFQLTLRAVRIESEAFGASGAQALRYINHPESDNSQIELTQEDYYALKRRAKEETSLEDWRVSVAMEQKVTAEAGRNLTLTRLKETSRQQIMEEKGSGHDSDR